ncbi:ParB N-terminal domain-containing protein [Adhaeretor mobilis]|uniref:ParB-like N-terminal domain-containing protein n=1 Tax=Adhaeretor mobilis TaxID=1930276 RepID=A0A517N2D1_9BACT|nr:ParB N-terminal domain-containing protein [Adhaeretor mobilis]QDT01281.1 hypothetical protein HG15A2_46230 [Adhaeretor mobilis]
MQYRDRIKGLRRVPAAVLRAHPRNWRTHPPAQQAAMRGVLAEIGYADALLVRELADGTLQLIDGHLRAQTTPDAEVPVLVLDVNEQEAEQILLTHDPLAAMAGVDSEQLDDLISDAQFEEPEVEKMIAKVGTATQTAAAALAAAEEVPEKTISESYQVVVECDDEQEQQAVYEAMCKEGRRCRVLTLA